MRRRVVITGMGMLTPVGNNVEDSFEALIHGVNGIDLIKDQDTSNWKVKIAAELKNLNLEDHLDKKDIKRSDRTMCLALIAATEAYQQANLKDANIDPYRFGTFVSSGIGGLNTILEEVRTSVTRGPDRISPFFIPNSIINLIGGMIAIRFQAKGPNLPIVTACSAATNSIGEAFRYIRDGSLDLAFAGGSEAPINELGIGGFASLRALNFTTNINEASTPFDQRRAGFVIAEGAGVLILEAYEHAIQRGANIIAEIVGYGSTTDAFHMTAPDENAEGITNCILQTLRDANLEKEQIAYINAHGTSTPLNDRLETLGIKKAFKDHAYNLNISSIKSMIGHTLGAAGAIESIATIKALTTSQIPPTINLIEPDPECDLNYTANVKVQREMNYAMNINIGFGGQNAALIFKKVDSI
jgi:3-oxoacyl-[acyl-carrier-protein] synthase II